MFKNFKKFSNNKGVTMIELLVVIFIFMVITGITIFNYGKFNSSQSIQNLADDIALSVRKAQSYAIGVHSTQNLFDIGYGVHFTVNPSAVSNIYSGTNKSFIIFSDMGSPQNKMYDYNGSCGVPTEGKECLEALNITSTDTITGINYKTSSGLQQASNTGVMDIVFKRPNPEPNFCYKNSIGNSTCSAGYGSATPISYIEIIISTADAVPTVKKVTINISGQISVSS